MLLKQTTGVWDLVWGKDGYRSQINARLAEQESDEGETTMLFEAYLLADYDDSVEELHEFVLRSLRTFQRLQTELRIKTQQGALKQPKVFPTRHFHLQPASLVKLNRIIELEIPRLMASSGAGYLNNISV